VTSVSNWYLALVLLSFRPVLLPPRFRPAPVGRISVNSEQRWQYEEIKTISKDIEVCLKDKFLLFWERITVLYSNPYRHTDF